MSVALAAFRRLRLCKREMYCNDMTRHHLYKSLPRVLDESHYVVSFSTSSMLLKSSICIAVCTF